METEEVTEIQIYNILMVDKTILVKIKNCFYLHIYNHCFKTSYHNIIMIDISLEEWEQLKESKKKMVNKKTTPVLFKVKKQAVDYLKRTKFNNK